MKRFDQSTKYKAFVHQRDETLERIFRNSRLKVTDIIDQAFIDAISFAQSRFPQMQFQPFNKQLRKIVDDGIDRIFDGAVQKILFEQVNLRRAAYVLSYAGEAEAVAQVTKQGARVKLGHDDIAKRVYSKLPDGTDIVKRFDLYFSDVRKKMISAIEQSLLFEDQPDQMLGRLLMALPRKKALPAKPVLRKVKKAKIAEAKKPSFSIPDPEGVTITLGPRGGVYGSSFDWDQASWDEVIKQANEDYVLIDRSPDTFFDGKNPITGQRVKADIPEDDKVYGWELEQQATTDFVSAVRSGQIDAAKEAGINEFIWIAVLDDRTCEKCCEWRSGLLTSEIEKVLADDKELRDHCDVISPPAHANCRCGIAPVIMGEQAGEELTAVTKDFDDWLNGN